MKLVTRRHWLKQVGSAMAAPTFPVFLDLRSFAATEAETQPKPTSGEREALANLAKRFLHRYKSPGLSVAIARHGTIVYEEAFGVADKKTGERVTPAHLFRLCSVTKPMTSVAIYTLIEQGKLKLDDLVFGPRTLLGKDFQTSGLPFTEEITIHHLLTHTAGGWSNSKNDPMFAKAKFNHHELIAWTLKNC